MADPWLVIVGIGEDGLAGLGNASRAALAAAEIVFGGPRHLDLAQVQARGRVWPVPFSVDPVLAVRGRKVVVLTSGDPFWFGAGGSLMAHLEPEEWVSHPVPSTFSLAANVLGWRLEEVACLGLHAAPLARMLPELGAGRRLICLLRDGAAVAELAGWLVDHRAGASEMWVMERLGGPSARVRRARAEGFGLDGIAAPVAVAVAVAVAGYVGIARTPGLADDAFAHDGQITKRSVRALTLCALAPRRGEMLWDLGAGSGSISVEWCLQGGRAWAVEARADRVAIIGENIARFGLAGRMELRERRIAEFLAGDLPVAPDAVFIGGGADETVLAALFAALPKGVRLVVNAVTLETEILLSSWHGRRGGDLLRIELARAEPLGRMRGWAPARPVVQWSVVL